MIPVATDFEDRTFRWRQLARQGALAIYEQQHKESGHCYYEVVRLQARETTRWPDGRITPAHEAYPGAKSWGTHGFTHWTLDAAQAHMADLLEASSREDARTAIDRAFAGEEG